MSVIELKNIGRIYGFGNASTLALDDVNLTIGRGEFVAIMGPSGSGKSTLMNIIGMLDTPTEGSYKMDGRIVTHESQKERAKLRRDKVGFIFQSFNLLPRLNAVENVALPLTYKGLPLVKRLDRAASMLESVDLGSRQYYMPHQLSGGQVQRIAVARALVNRPSIVLADEPTGNLDTNSSVKIMELLKEIHEAGNTIIMVTHNPELAEYADRFILLRDGGVEADLDNYHTMLAKVVRSNRKAKAEAVREVERDREAKEQESKDTVDADSTSKLDKAMKLPIKSKLKEAVDKDSLAERTKKRKKQSRKKRRGRKR